MKTKFLILAGATLFVLSAQQPTCKMCSATYIGKEEFDAYVARAT